MKLAIYVGKDKPLVAVGVNQCNLLGFAEKYRGWHSFKNDRPTKRAIKALENKGYLEVVGEQFRLK